MLTNIPLSYVVVVVAIGVASFGLNVFTIVKLAVVGTELRVLRQVLAGDLSAKQPPAFDFDKALKVAAEVLQLYAQIQTRRPTPAPVSMGGS